jgi:predicted phosphodiesterase
LVEPTVTATIEIEPAPSATNYAGPVLSEEGGEYEFIIPLTIQRAMEESIDVFFVLDRPGVGFLFYWPLAGDYRQGAWIPLREDTAAHYLNIPDLESGQHYMAMVGMDDGSGEYRAPMLGGEPWAPISMHLPPTEDPIRIAVIGDSGFGEELTYQLVEAMAEHDPDLVVHVGDVVYKIFQEGDPRVAFKEKYFQPFSPVLHIAPVYPVPGNHEYDVDAYLGGTPYYFTVFPPFPEMVGGEHLPDPVRREWYALEVGSTQILLLNSQLLFQGRLVEEQTEWLRGRLADDRFENSVIVFHVPPYSSSRHAAEGRIVASRWGDILAQASDRIVLAGHEHVYERLVVDGVTYLISGGGSSVTYPLIFPHPGSQFFDSISHYIILDVYPDRAEFVSYAFDGSTIEAGEIRFSAD